MDAHQNKLATERRRLAAIDQAEREAREEIKAEKLRREAERKRLEEEQQAMFEWEATQPPPPADRWAVVAEPLAEAVVADGDLAGHIRVRLLGEDFKEVEGEPTTPSVNADERETLQRFVATDLSTVPELEGVVGVRLLLQVF